MKKLYYFSISSNFLIFLNPPIFISFSLCLEPSIYDLCSILCMWGGRKSMKYVPPSHFCIQSRTQYIAYNMSVTPLPLVQFVISNMCPLPRSIKLGRIVYHIQYSIEGGGAQTKIALIVTCLFWIRQTNGRRHKQSQVWRWPCPSKNLGGQYMKYKSSERVLFIIWYQGSSSLISLTWGVFCRLQIWPEY